MQVRCWFSVIFQLPTAGSTQGCKIWNSHRRVAENSSLFEWIVTNISEDHGAVIFMDRLTMKLKAPHAFEMMGTTHMTENLNL